MILIVFYVVPRLVVDVAQDETSNVARLTTSPLELYPEWPLGALELPLVADLAATNLIY